MEKHSCKLCYRSFANGKALGGHMRSHMMFLNTSSKSSPPNEVEKDQDSDDSDSVYFSTSSDEEIDDQKGGTKRPASVESETRNYPVFKRSKRVPRSNIDGFFQMSNSGKTEGKSKSNEHSSLTSISEDSPEEDVAHCLMMMSRDTWTGAPMEFFHEKEVEEEEEEEDAEDYFSEDSDFGKVVKASSSKVRGKYKCETCNKLFKSYQALGGHRTSHKKPKVNTLAVGSSSQVAGPPVEKVYECPFCDRVFSSGQAFGGHKRSHFVGGGVVSTLRSNVRPVGPVPRNVRGALELDLNLPAPVEDEDEVSNSAVSDA